MENVPEIITNLLPEKISIAELFKPGFIDPTLGKIKAINDEFLKTASVETSAGRKEIASHARKNSSSKVWLDDMGKTFVETSKKAIKIVDTERKKIRDFFDLERDRAREPLTKWEAVEAEKEELRRLEIEKDMDWDEALQMDNLFNREREIKQKEAEFARIEAEAKAKAESERIGKERIEREEQIRKEAAERAAREAAEKIEAEKRRAAEAEQKAKEAAEKAERDRMAAEERAKLEAERAEQARIAAFKKAEEEKQAAIKKALEDAAMDARAKKEAEEREAARIRAEADKKAADKKHQAKINNEILADLMVICGLPEIGAKAIIGAVAKQKISHMRIQY